MTLGTGLVCVPDDDGAVEATLGRLEEVLSVLHEIEEEDLREGFAGTVPAQLRGGRALEAVRSVQAAVAVAARSCPQPVLDGGYELVPLGFARLDADDVARLGSAVAALAGALPTTGRWVAASDTVAHEVLQDQCGFSSRSPKDLVDEFGRLHALLSLPADDDVARLAEVLPADAGEVTLTGPARTSYDAVTGRVMATWHAGDRLAPFVYGRLG